MGMGLRQAFSQVVVNRETMGGCYLGKVFLPWKVILPKRDFIVWPKRGFIESRHGLALVLPKMGFIENRHLFVVVCLV